MNCRNVKTWFKLSWVKSYRNCLKGNKNYFELVGGWPWSYCGFKLWLLRIKVQKMYEGNPGEIDFGLSYWEVWVSKGLSYRKSTVLRWTNKAPNQIPERFCIVSMEFLLLRRRHPLWQNIPHSEEEGEMAVVG